VTTGITCANAGTGCRGIATPEHPECSRCTRERKLAAMRESGSFTANVFAWLIEHTPHHDLGLSVETDREAGG
jgi:hypothetical protein